MPIATRDPTTSPNPFRATERVLRLFADQDRALRRLFGTSLGEYFRLKDQLRRAAVGPTFDRAAVADWSAAARVANLGTNGGMVKAAADGQRLALASGASRAAARLAETPDWPKHNPGSSVVPAGIVQATLDT